MTDKPIRLHVNALYSFSEGSTVDSCKYIVTYYMYLITPTFVCDQTIYEY